MRVLVLHQAVDISREDEADTLLQAEEIAAHVQALGHDAPRAAIASLGELEAVLARHMPDCVFNLVESFYGADKFAYLVPGVLEARGIPFTGNKAKALLLASDKGTLKSLLHAHGVMTPRGVEAGDNARYIVKSISEHASFGIDQHSVVLGVGAAKQLIAAKTAQYGGQWLAEEYIEGREINLPLLAKGDVFTLCSPTEIIFENFPEDMFSIFDYAAKWDATSYAYHHTSRCFVEGTVAMEKTASKIWKALGLSGYVRVDARMDAEGNFFVIDVNPNPRLCDDSGFMAAAQQTGLSPIEVVQAILEDTYYADSRTSFLVA